MPNPSIPSAPRPEGGGQIAEALAHVEKVIRDGLKHGHFECSIACEIGNGGKRHLMIRAGKSHRFTIPAGEVAR